MTCKLTTFKSNMITLILDKNAVVTIGPFDTDILEGDVVGAGQCEGEVVAWVAGGVVQFDQ